VYRFFSILSLVFLLLLTGCSKKVKVNQKPTEIKKISYDVFGFVKDSLTLKIGKVKKNETLADILIQFGLSYQLITEVFNKTKPTFDFRNIRPNKNYFTYLNSDSTNSLNTFIYEIDKINYVKVSFTDSIAVSRNKKDVIVTEKSITGTINSSLYQTLAEANASPLVANKLAEVFAWQIDFYTIQKGDRFFAVYIEKYIDDELVDIGDVLVAKFIHKNNEFNAYLFYQDKKNEYFDEEGQSLQKEFLKAPLKFKRISSKFSRRRLHPIFRTYRPHLGIDYAATIGTPVQSVGDGIVIYKQRNGGAGRYVKVRHNSVYTSGYMHLSKYGHGIKVGTKVKQGQIIGYVGQSGHATGPHLDFRFWKNGTPVNYMTQKFPSSKSVVKEKLNEFYKIRDELSIKLNKVNEKILVK